MSLVLTQTQKDGTKTSFGYAPNDTMLEQTTTVDGIENTNTFGYTLDFLTSLKHNNFAVGYVIGVLKDNQKARRIYEKWGGKLEDFMQPFVKLGVNYDEVFYTYNI